MNLLATLLTEEIVHQTPPKCATAAILLTNCPLTILATDLFSHFEACAYNQGNLYYLSNNNDIF